jgi:Cu/Ag efflux pump CusA
MFPERMVPTAATLLLAVGVALLIYGLATRPSQQKCVANTVVYLHEALQRRIAAGVPITNAEIHAAVVEGAVHRLRPKLITVSAVLASLAPTSRQYWPKAASVRTLRSRLRRRL